MPEGGNIPPNGPNDRSAVQQTDVWQRIANALERIAAALEAK